MNAANSESLLALLQRAELADHETFADQLWELLSNCYREPQRHYHDLRHIDFMLRHWSESAEPEDTIAWAIWFHDAVYDPRSSSNEAESAALFRHRMGERLPTPTVDAIERLILATDPRTPPAQAEDEQLLSDLDLLILGSSPETYNAYADSVRKEYAFVPDRDFAVGRVAVMETFLERERIYLTERYDAYEKPARANIQREIDEWVKRRH